jgi:hypothetical protein
MMLITRANKDSQISASCAEGNILIFGWDGDLIESNHSARHFINVRKMASSSDQVEQDAVLELSHPKNMVSV